MSGVEGINVNPIQAAWLASEEERTRLL